MKPAIYVFLLFAMTLAILTLLDKGFIGGAAITGGFAIAAIFTAVFAGVPGIIRSAYDAVWGVQELQIRGAQVRQAQESAGIIAYRAGQNMAISDPTGRPWQIIGPAARYADQQNQEPEAFVEDQPQQLTALELGLEAERAMVVGGTRSGKTFFCKQLAHHRLRKGDLVYAIDPKDPDPHDPWPPGTVVIGESDNFDEMETFFRWLIQEEKPRRGKKMGRIQKEPFLLIFFDEVPDCLYERPELADHYIRILRKFAQYRIGLFVIGQSDDVKSIGLQGLSQLKTCFDVRLLFEKDPFTGERKSYARIPNRAEIELVPYPVVPFGGEKSCAGADPVHRHPTPGRNARNTASEAPFDSGVGVSRLGYDPNAQTYVYEPEPGPQIYETRDSRTATVIRMAKAGASVSDIAKGVFGSKGGRQNGVVKRILGEFGLRG